MLHVRALVRRVPVRTPARPPDDGTKLARLPGMIPSSRRAWFALACAAVAVVACRATQPGEAPPLAPRPEQPSEPTADPVPGVPDRIEPGVPGPTIPQDAGPGPVTRLDPPVFESSVAMQAAPDAGVVRDAAVAGDAGLLTRDAAPADAPPALPPDAPRGIPRRAP